MKGYRRGMILLYFLHLSFLLIWSLLVLDEPLWIVFLFSCKSYKIVNYINQNQNKSKYKIA